MSTYKIFKTGDVLFQSGKNAVRREVGYHTHGHLYAVRDNAIVRLSFAKLCL